MDNVKMNLDKNGILTITVDTNAKGSPSSSGKTILVGTTNGTVKIAGGRDGLAMGLNVWIPNKG
jgi:hypothetical protein